MKFGLTPEEYALLHQLVIIPLQDQGAKIWCFGSRAQDTFTQFSDIDLMVESVQDLTPLIGKVHESIRESNFPYKVDIIDLKNFAKEYLPHFEAQKKLFT